MDETSHVPAAGSMFFPISSQVLNLLKPPIQETIINALDSALDNNENSILASMIFDMLSIPLPIAPLEKLLHVRLDHNPETISNHIAEEIGDCVEQEQLFDPVCFLNLPELKVLEQRFLQSNSEQEDVIRATGGNDGQEIPCAEYPLPPCITSTARNYESEKGEAFAHRVEEQNLIQTNCFAGRLMMQVEHNVSATDEFASEKVCMDHRLVYSHGSTSGFQNQKAKRKRYRSISENSQEMESQRMIHIAVERNRRKQMNEHVKILRSLMPVSYVQKNDQASIIGGAIEFVKELEQLRQCLESQKRKRLCSDAPQKLNCLLGDCSPVHQPALQNFSTYPLPSDANIFDSSIQPLREEVAEVTSPMADIKVKLLGCNAIINILCERRTRHLLNAIAALEKLQFSVFHINITAIQHMVLYSFNVQVNMECSSTAKEIATSFQQIFCTKIQTGGEC